MTTDLRQLNNEDLVRHVVEQKALTPMEIELVLRLEQYVAAYGDYLGKADGNDT